MSKHESRDKADRILDVAEKLFSSHGYDGTTTRMLAKEANVNLGMLTYYFGSKENIFQELINRRFIGVAESFIHITKDHTDYWSMIDSLVEWFVDDFFQHRDFYKSLMREMSKAEDNYAKSHAMKLIHQNSQSVYKAIEDGIQEGVFRKVDVPMVFHSFTGIIIHYTVFDYFSARMLAEYPDTQTIFDDKHKILLKKFVKDIFNLYLSPESELVLKKNASVPSANSLIN
jgi:AcrR family transcriptional regulator